jgi:hypothetical protein
MNNLWHRVFSALTKGVDFHRVIINAFVFASVATLLTIPYFHYLITTVARGDLSGTIPGHHHFLPLQLFLLFVICLLSAVVGFTFGKRYALPGFGASRRYIHDLPLLLAAGAALMIISCVFFDRYFYMLSPGSYPEGLLYLLVIPLKGAVAEELILRFGLVTIGVGICRNRYAGVILVAVFATLLSIRYFIFIGIDIAFSYIFIVQVILTFLVNCILGYLFVTRGLVYAMTVKLVYGVKYVLVALVMA